MSSLLGDLPRLFPRPEQTIAGIGRLLRRGELSCVDILNHCLEQVEEWEPKVHAWVVLDREGAMEQARALDQELRSGQDRGPLHGIPMGIKDIIDVKGLPTACGAKRWVDRIADEDADVVARLRRAGAVIMGKTVTTPYAWIDPPPTRNPWNLDRSPGGSSSGSAAAVACGMCYGAIGTQTGGSITRPASFCGVAGMKPGRAQVWTNGVLPFAPSLDHVGPIARGVRDLALIFDIVWRASAELRRQLMHQAPSDGPVRLGRLRGFFDRRLEEPGKTLMDEAMRTIGGRGAEVIDVDDPVDFEQILVHHRTIMAAEAAETHNEWLEESPDDYPRHIRALIEEGRPILAMPYIRAKSGRDAAWRALIPLFLRSQLDAVVTPATIGGATDPSTTGDPAFNSPWSFVGVPTVSFPIGLSSEGLPLAMQLAGSLLSSLSLLRTAEWCETAIRKARQ